MWNGPMDSPQVSPPRHEHSIWSQEAWVVVPMPLHVSLPKDTAPTLTSLICEAGMPGDLLPTQLSVHPARAPMSSL